MVISITIPTKASHQNDERLSIISYLIAFRSISIAHKLTQFNNSILNLLFQLFILKSNRIMGIFHKKLCSKSLLARDMLKSILRTESIV